MAAFNSFDLKWSTLGTTQVYSIRTKQFLFLLVLVVSVSESTTLLLRSDPFQLSVGKRSWDQTSLHSSIEDSDGYLPLDEALRNRYACKGFKRFNDDDTLTTTANVSIPSIPAGTMGSASDPAVVRKALECINLARLAPSSFNTQPYKIIMVHSPEQKASLAPACLGPNARRVLNADCTAVFLADRKVLLTLPRLTRFLESQQEKSSLEGRQGVDNKQKPALPAIYKLYIAVFSSGYPLPRILSAILSFLQRTATSFVHHITQRLFRYPLPTLSSSETWATKNVMLVAMAYMLACSARNLATIPMEGIHAGDIRRALKIPRRYAIPLIVATGVSDRAAPTNVNHTKRRYPASEVIFENEFGAETTIAE